MSVHCEVLSDYLGPVRRRVLLSFVLCIVNLFVEEESRMCLGSFWKIQKIDSRVCIMSFDTDSSILLRFMSWLYIWLRVFFGISLSMV